VTATRPSMTVAGFGPGSIRFLNLLAVVACWLWAACRSTRPPATSLSLHQLRWDVIFSEFCHNQGQAMEKRRAKAGPGATSRPTLRQ
jgi:hypothetical protein